MEGMKMRGWILLIGLCLLSGCTGLVEKTGQFLEAGFSEKTLGRYRGTEGMEIRHLRVKKDGDQREKLLVSWPAYPGVQIQTSAPDAQGRVFLEELHFIGGSYTGWNAFTLELTGEARLILQRTGALWRGQGPVERVQIVRGKIRRKERRLSGEEALTALRNRYDRIAALTEWMHTQEGLPDFTGQEHFASYWKPYLMPELVPAGKRPAAWTTEGASWVRGEEVAWNRLYTEQGFPESLWVLRNSGALLRDWEEALSWIYLDYHWDRMVQGISREYLLITIR